MVVNSISFLLFFAVVFIVYYLLKGKDGKRQNLWLLVASYFFYGYTEWRMLPLLIFTTLFFYGLGIAIGYYNEKDEKKASFLTTFSVLGGISILLYFTSTSLLNHLATFLMQSAFIPMGMLFLL